MNSHERRVSMPTAATLLAFIVLVSGQKSVSAWPSEKPDRPPPQAKVWLSASKRVYKIGEPIVVSYRVENVGHEPFYLYPQLVLVDGAGAGFGITIEDARGKPIPQASVLEGFPLLYRQVRITEHIRNHWILLHPRFFYGTSDTYLHQPPTKPGKYKITGAFWNRIPDWLSAEQKLSLRDLEHPILVGVHAATPVWIEVRK